MNGASAEGNFRTYRGYTTVVDVTAAHTGQINNTGQPFSLLMERAGSASISGLDTSGKTDSTPTIASNPLLRGWWVLLTALIRHFPARPASFEPTANSCRAAGGRWVGREVSKASLLPRHSGRLRIYSPAQSCRQRPEPAAHFLRHHHPPLVTSHLPLSLWIHSRIYAGQFRSSAPLVSQCERKAMESWSTSLTSPMSRTIKF